MVKIVLHIWLKKECGVLRGCKRQIILLKGTDSQIFDEAYFLVRRSAEKCGQEEIVREAQRIVDRNTTRRRTRRVRVRDVLLFAAGVIFGVVCGLLFGILL